MKRLLPALGLAAATAFALTGCGSSAASNADASCQNTITKTDAQKVTVWAWYPEIEKVVDVFNDTHDDLQICWSNVGTGKDEYTKLTTALQAGSGAPDVVMLETSVVPSFIAQKGLVDLYEHGAAEVEKNYAAGSWADESSGDGVYAIPVDGGPVGYFYRQDIFDAYGLTVPTTWAEYAEQAQKLKDAGSESLLGNYPSNGRHYQDALFAQAGSKPFELDGTDITIDLDNEPTAKVMDYWNGLVQDGLIGKEDGSNSDYNTHLVDGTYASVIAGAWLPGYLASYTGADTDAVWRVAPLPQWDAADPTQVKIGGSAFAVTTQAVDKDAAATVAMEIFGTEAAWKIGIEEAALFPLWTPVLESDGFRDREYPFFGGQQINKDVFLEAADGYEGFEVSPFQNYVYDKLTETLNAVNSGDSTVDDALTGYQKSVVDYATGQGFSAK